MNALPNDIGQIEPEWNGEHPTVAPPRKSAATHVAALGPDLDAHVQAMRNSAIFVGILAWSAAMLGTGFFLGWVIWG